MLCTNELCHCDSCVQRRGIIPTKYSNRALQDVYLTRALERYARKTSKGLERSRKIRLESLPGDLNKRLNALAGIAYKLLINDKFIFSQEDLEDSDVAGMELEKMGLVTSFTIEDGYGETENFQFLHLTIQEFLAAWHASQLSPEEQAGITCDFSNSRLKLMRYLLAGITKLQGQIVRDAFTQSFKDALTPDTPGKKCNGEAVLDQLHMIYEAQSPEICKQVSRNFPEQTIHFNWYRRRGTVFLCKVVSFFLSNSSCAWKKVFLDGLLMCNTACLQAFHVTGCSGSIQELRLFKIYSEISLDSSSLIPKIPLFQKVESLSVTFSFPTPDPRKCSVLSTLANLFQMQHLKKVSYFESIDYLKLPQAAQAPLYVPLSSSPELLQAPPAAQALSVPNTLQELHLHLSHLCLRYYNPWVMELLGRGIEVSEIRDFSFDGAVVENENASDGKVYLEMIALVLPYIAKMKHLEHLSLSGPSSISKYEQDPEPTAGDDRLKSLHTLLKSTKTLKKLTIRIPDMIPYCVDYICDGLKENSTLSELDIISNNSCDLFPILDSLSIHRMEIISLEVFTANELMKIWKVVLDRNILSEFQVIRVSTFFTIIRNSDSTNVQKVKILWSCVDSSDAFEILNSLKDRCQNIKNLKLTFEGVLVSTHTTQSKECLLTEQLDTTQCKIGEILAYFLLNCECTFDFSAIYPHFQPLYLDIQMSFVAPYLSYGMSEFPQDSFLIHNKIIYTNYGAEHINNFTLRDHLHHNRYVL